MKNQLILLCRFFSLHSISLQQSLGKTSFIGILIAVSLLGTVQIGCKYQVKVDPYPNIQRIKKQFPVRVGIFIDDLKQKEIKTERGFLLVGFVHSWDIPVGEALTKSTERSFKKLFTNVKTIVDRSSKKHNTLNIVFTPKIKDFSISQGITTTFVLKAEIFDRRKKLIYTKEVTAQSKGKTAFAKACLGGVFAGKSAFSDSVTSAFEDAYEKLFSDMLYSVDFSKYSFRKNLKNTIKIAKKKVKRILIGKIVDIKSNEIIVGSKNAGALMLMGDWVYTIIDDKKVYMKVKFPMMTIAKCKLGRSYSKYRKKIRVNQKIYK